MRDYTFFALMARMKYIERWSLMRNSARENISEHSMEVAMLAHALGVISNEKCGSNYNPEKLALMGLYHDANEIITGDLPTPVKYHDEDINIAYSRVEDVASEELLNKLPDYMRPYYEPLFFPRDDDKDCWKIVKAADKLSALIKCIEEEKAGNHEFDTAYLTIEKALVEMDMEEVDIFMNWFLPSYHKTLDELQE
ncbi:5'-deoxynucleotidase [Eubacterium xylanophilum]|uniref:5'-deoxynucleotidase n=1 Tax=Eubacterium xylanophilum TaxID=39497 RepID=UPI00047C7EEF|nr:5'-deoxynucleotidase [Eubacterium xylanophilum]